MLTAASAAEALLICEQAEAAIALLLTDVVMPQMAGCELATRLARIRPNLRVIFMSGYTDNAVVKRGVLASGVHFIQKPFLADELTEKVRAVLDE